MAPDLKKIPAKNYMAPDPANFLHQLPQKESGEKLYGSRSCQLSHQLPQKELDGGETARPLYIYISAVIIVLGETEV